MRPSVLRVVLFVFVDAILRAVLYPLIMLNPLGVFFGIALSVFCYVPICLAIVLLANSQEKHCRRGFLADVAIANVLFVVVVAALWVSMIKSGQQTACSGNSCSWVRGEIQWQGAITMSWILLVVATPGFLSSILLARTSAKPTQY